jgi:hypothetical protein
VTSHVPDSSGPLAVLGLLANSELVAFSRLATDAVAAPDVRDRIELCRLGGVAAQRLGRLGERVAELGGELTDVVAPFIGTYADFDARTRAGSWYERLLKAYVGFGVEDDVARLLATRLDPQSRALVLDVLDDDGYSALVLDRLKTAMASDPVLASRLALWGRRLVGEALGVVQRVITVHTDLRVLLEEALPKGGSAGELQQRLFAVLTGEHTRRMERLGLTA